MTNSDLNDNCAIGVFTITSHSSRRMNSWKNTVWFIFYLVLLLLWMVKPAYCYAETVYKNSGIASKAVDEVHMATYSRSFYESLPDSAQNDSRLILSVSDTMQEDLHRNDVSSNDVESGGEEGAASKAPDYEGLRKDSYYFLGYQILVVGALYVSPQSVSGWSSEQKKDFTIQKYYNDVTDIVWDHDKLYINYVLHPYWGMSYYVRARDRGLSQRGAFGYSMLLSTLWEFGIEAMFEKVSIQDLFITPMVGSVIGKYVDTYRDGIRQKPVKSQMDEVMLDLTDPLGSLNQWVENKIGKGASVSLSYSMFQKPNLSAYQGQGYVDRDYEPNVFYKYSPTVGVTFNYKL